LPTSEGKNLTKCTECIDAYAKKAEKNRNANDEKVGGQAEKARPIYVENKNQEPF